VITQNIGIHQNVRHNTLKEGYEERRFFEDQVGSGGPGKAVNELSGDGKSLSVLEKVSKELAKKRERRLSKVSAAHLISSFRTFQAKRS